MFDWLILSFEFSLSYHGDSRIFASVSTEFCAEFCGYSGFWHFELWVVFLVVPRYVGLLYEVFALNYYLKNVQEQGKQLTRHFDLLRDDWRSKNDWVPSEFSASVLFAEDLLTSATGTRAISSLRSTATDVLLRPETRRILLDEQAMYGRRSLANGKRAIPHERGDRWSL